MRCASKTVDPSEDVDFFPDTRGHDEIYLGSSSRRSRLRRFLFTENRRTSKGDDWNASFLKLMILQEEAYVLLFSLFSLRNGWIF